MINLRVYTFQMLTFYDRFVFTDKNRLPASKAMEKCRLDTFLFGDGWIHDGQRNHGASSKKVCNG